MDSYFKDSPMILTLADKFNKALMAVIDALDDEATLSPRDVAAALVLVAHSWNSF